MLHYCYLFLFLLLGWRGTTAAAPPNGSDELARHACTLDRNGTLQSVFLEDVISRYNLSLRQDQTNLNYPPGAYLGRVLNIPCYSCLQTNPNASYHGTVMWCISIWHPTQLIESCFNRTWNYSSPLARELGILNNIIIIDSCYVIFWRYEECLQIKRVELYYERAILTSIRGTFHSISILNVQYPPQPPELEEFPHSPLYAPVGSDLLLDCVYSSTANLNNYISWLLSNDTELKPIAEDPTCSSDCYNDTRPLSMRSKANRIRVYQARDQFPCIFLNYKIHTYLYIKNLQLSDRNNYTCYHRYYNSWREEKKYETLHIVPVLPVIKPVWLQVPDSTIYIDTNDTDGDVFNISLSCVVRVGLGASVQWVDPEYNIIEEYSEEWVSMYVIASNSSTPNDYEFIARRTLVIKDYTDDISGEYKCVVTGRNLTEEYTVHLKTTSDASSSSTLSSSTASSSTSTSSSSLSSSSYSVTTSSLAPPTSNPHSTSDTHQLILVLSGAFIVTFLVLFSLIAAFIIYCRYRSLSSSMKSSLSATGGTVQVLTKGIMAPPNFLFFPKFDMSEREVSRQHLMFIDRLGSGLFGQVWKAYILGSETIVAVKTTKDHCSVRDEDNLREELKIMKKIQPHANVINLLGFCTNDGPVCIIMEHALYGNLHDFLKHCRPPLFPSRRSSASYNVTMSPLSSSFSSSCSSPSSSSTPFLPSADRSSHLPLSAQLSNSTTHTYLQFSSEVTTPPPSLDQFSLDEGVRGKSVFDTFSQQVFDLLPPAHSVCPLSHDYINVPCTIRNGDFLNFAFQIASGLDHLKKMNLIHCDLAARNILVSKEQVLKISDFGLSKEVSDDKSYYRRNPRDRIPIKWTAPEALETWVYSHKSDIWSYGIVLWEIATYGESPYNEVKTSGIWDVMISYLKAGNRLEQPMDCPDIFYNIMSLCWELDPTARPDPNDIIQLLSHKSSGGHDEVETSP